jgi:DNA-binding transcriptional ArsR family regulator
MDPQALRAEIIALLALNSQKATYEALSSIVGWTPRTVMRDLAKTENNRWIVDRGNDLPTGFPDELLPDWFRTIHNTLRDRAALGNWLLDQGPGDDYPNIQGFIDGL